MADFPLSYSNFGEYFKSTAIGCPAPVLVLNFLSIPLITGKNILSRSNVHLNISVLIRWEIERVNTLVRNQAYLLPFQWESFHWNYRVSYNSDISNACIEFNVVLGKRISSSKVHYYIFFYVHTQGTFRLPGHWWLLPLCLGRLGSWQLLQECSAQK